MDRATETDLVQKALAGDRRAFDMLVNEHYDALFRLAWRWCGRRSDAEDCTHDALIKFAEKLPRFRGQSSLRTWLYRIMMNTIHDWQRRQKRETGRYGVLKDEVPGPDQPDQNLHAQTILDYVRELPDHERAALLLVAGENMSHAEAASILGCREKTVSWRIHSARRKLSTRLEGEIK